jgi:hypothetical protein
MKKFKAIPLTILALMLSAGAFFFPVTAHAQTADATPPTVTVKIDGDMLKVEAKDDVGVEAVFINEHRFSTLVNGTASVRLKDYAGTDKQVSVYATDTAGNRSLPVLIDNPYYTQPAQSPPVQQPAPTPAPQPSAPASTGAPATPEPASALPEPLPPAPSDGEDMPEATESVIPGGGNAFTPDGGGTVLDNATEQEGKEFFTVTATDGSVYYLIIDRQRGTENVYFLSAVTREDLLALTESGAVTEPGLSQPEPQAPEAPASTEEPQTEQPAQNNGGGMGTLVFVLIVIAIAGGAGYYFKIVKPRKEAAQMREDEYEDNAYDENDMTGEDDISGDADYADEPDEAGHEYLSGADAWTEDGE